MRIREASAQAGYLIVVAVGVALVGLPLAVVRFEWGYACVVLALVAAAVVAGRTFRGRAESDDARPWWKMTTSRRNSIVLGILFALQGISAVATASDSPSPAVVIAGGVVLLAVAALYANSAIRIRLGASTPVA
ncbi:hypothetical protein [uncultured Microbacterium sp.]|jgi:hypothetical protein|uniref:hypothetical protein n=1 Tax=Microbacterium algeriense TaxID=2615184 RepID=UPI002592F06A|nr:hypothetical protein [uncultured Microbacterium sp.]